MTPTLLAVDTETNSLRAHEAGVGFMAQWAGEPGTEVAVTGPGAKAPLAAALAGADELVMANAPFDTHVIRSTWGVDLLRGWDPVERCIFGIPMRSTSRLIRDVQTLARVTVPGRFDYRLESLGDSLLGTDSTEQQRALKELAKSVGIGTLKQEGAHRAVWDAYPTQLEDYGKEDVRITYDLYQLLLERASPSDLRVFDLECEVQRVLMTAEQHGVLVDKDELALLRTRLEAELADAHTKLLEWLPPEALGSDDDPANQAALREGLIAAGVPLYKHTPSSGKLNEKTGKRNPVQLATNKDALGEFEDSNEVIGLLFTWRRLGKTLSTYVAALERANPRVHANFLSCEARTSRMSCIAQGTYIDAPRNLLLAPKGIPIEHVRVGQLVYSHGADGVPRTQRVLAKTFMGNKKVLRLVWRACGSKSYLGELVATPDHRVRLDDGTYRRMDELRPNDKLAYLGRSMNASGYATLRWGADRKVAEHVHLRPGHETVHHRNRVPQDNSLDNLQGCTRSEHSRLHAVEGAFFGGRGARRPAPCPYNADEFRFCVEGGVRAAMLEHGHEHAAWKRWSAELGIEIPDKRGSRNNHRVVMVMSDGEERPTWDLTIENTPCFIANEIGVHNCRSPNMQNLPRGSGARNAIIPAKGNTLVVVDYDSIEVWVLGHYLSRACGNRELLDLLESGIDMHTATAAKVFGAKPLSKGGPPPHLRGRDFRDLELLAWYTKGGPGDAQRTLAKETTFSSLYGIGYRKLSRRLGVSEEAGKEIKGAVLNAIPGYWDLYDKLQAHMKRVGFLRTALWRRLDVPKGKPHINLNTVVQGTAAEIMKLGMLAAEAPLAALDYQIIMVVHDELVSEGPAENAPAATAACITAMESVHALVDHNGDPLFDCSLKATGSHTTTSYGDAK